MVGVSIGGLQSITNDFREAPLMSILTLPSTGFPSPVHFISSLILGVAIPALYSRISLVSICAGS